LIWTMLLVSLALQAQTRAPAQEPAEDAQTIVRTFRPPPNGVMRCMRRLPGGTVIDTQMTCRVNSVAGPTACTFDPDDLTREERYAAVCYSRGYMFRYPNGRPATGRMVSYRMTISVPNDEPSTMAR
jgi:hypothetical protein